MQLLWETLCWECLCCAQLVRNLQCSVSRMELPEPVRLSLGSAGCDLYSPVEGREALLAAMTPGCHCLIARSLVSGCPLERQPKSLHDSHQNPHHGRFLNLPAGCRPGF